MDTVTAGYLILAIQNIQARYLNALLYLQNPFDYNRILTLQTNYARVEYLLNTATRSSCSRKVVVVEEGLSFLRSELKRWRCGRIRESMEDAEQERRDRADDDLPLGEQNHYEKDQEPE